MALTCSGMSAIGIQGARYHTITCCKVYHSLTYIMYNIRAFKPELVDVEVDASENARVASLEIE
jgi:hypothetical protein